MNREEIKAEAKRVGLKVRENFTDDWPENLLILGVGFALGWGSHILYHFFK